MPTDTGNKIGLYLVNGVAGNEGTPGAPVLHFSLLVNAATGTITGQAVQTQAVPPPGDKIVVGKITGIVRSTGFGHFTKIVALEGHAVISMPPPAIGSYLAPFSAHFAIDDKWNGTGGWTLGNTDVNNVPVKAIE
jgi:Domain of unknown function (DUF1842)